MMKDLIYRVIYWPPINRSLLTLNKIFRAFLPKGFLLPPTGSIDFKVNGDRIVMHTNQTSYLTQLVYWNGPRSFEYTSLFIDLVQDMNVFIDIGANTGYYSLIAARIAPKIQVHAFEPASGPLHFLKLNVLANGNSNVTIVDEALSDREGDITFYETGSVKFPWIQHVLAGDGSALENGSRTVVHEKKVKSGTLDHYCEQQGLHQVDLIKIDTEGTEPAVLKGASAAMEKFKPIIICETLYQTTEEDLDALITAQGYLIFKHTNNGLVQAPRVSRTTDDGVRNCFFVHPSKKGLLDRLL